MNFNYYLFKLLDKLLLIVGAAELRPELLLLRVVAPLLLLREVCRVLLLRSLLLLLRLTLPVVLQLGLDVLRMLLSKPRHRLLVGLAGTDDNRRLLRRLPLRRDLLHLDAPRHKHLHFRPTLDLWEVEVLPRPLSTPQRHVVGTRGLRGRRGTCRSTNASRRRRTPLRSYRRASASRQRSPTCPSASSSAPSESGESGGAAAACGRGGGGRSRAGRS